MPTRPHDNLQFRRGLSLLEVMLASGILAISSASIMTAFVAGTQISNESAKYQQAAMLASNMIEEIKLLPMFENSDYNQDDLKSGVAGCDGNSPYREETGCGNDPAPSGGVRTTFDDMTDYADYVDGTGSSLGNFLDRAGLPLVLFADNVSHEMFREVRIFKNILGEPPNNEIDESAGEEPLVEVHVIVYVGTAPAVAGTPKLSHLVRTFGAAQ